MSPVRGRSRLANDAWEMLLTAHARLMKEFQADDLWSEVSIREYDVLYTLSKHSRPIRLSDLNQHVLLSQPALSRMVDRLVARGLVRRDADARDRRSIRLSLTEAGRATQHELGRRHAHDVTTAMAAALSADELETLEALCRRLVEARDAEAAA